MKRKMPTSVLAFALVTAWLVTAIGAAPQRQFDPPFKLPVGVRLEQDIVFSKPAGHALRVDLFAPEEEEGLRPAIVFILGSAWRGGDKSHFWRQAAHMAGLGFVSICIEHRGSADAKYPAAVDDAKTAVRWLRAHAAQYRVDPERIGAAGGSSGGHLASLLGVTAEVPNHSPTSEYAEFSAKVSAVAAFNPAEDLVEVAKTDPGAAAVLAFLGASYDEKPELWREASPVTHVSKDSAAFLILHGTADEATPYSQAIAMVDALKKVGVQGKLFTAEGASHGFFNRPPWYEPTLERMTQFFLRTLGAGGKTP